MQPVQPEMQCRNCQKIGDFAVVCCSARVNEVTTVGQEADHSGRHFLGEIETKYTYVADSNTPWTVKLTIRDTPVTFKIDTGAGTSISDETYHKLKHLPQLASDDMDFDSPGGKLDGLGQFRALTKYKGRQYKFIIHVVKTARCNSLFGRAVAIEKKSG